MCREIHHGQFTNIFLFISYFISPSASGSRVTLSVHQREVNETVHQSVLLPVSYSTLTPYSTLTIEWCLFPGYTPFVRLMRSNCSPDPDRSAYNCSDHRVTTPSYRERIHLYPENGSLLLRDLQLSDSGVYLITVYRGGNTSSKGNVTLTVYPGTDCENASTPGVSESPQNQTTTPSGTGWDDTHIRVSAAVCLLILLICFCLLMTKIYRGCHRQHDSVVQPNGGTRQDLVEVRASTTNDELTYCLIQWSEPRNTSAAEPDTRERPPEAIYALAKKPDRR
ncbi:uncharacterized protein [Heterodontus francisci]|uniref:uncharacterized protein isoform X1 n=1 Tax=Heterodontus francisci TaxID=7792 RepID=UPI00355AE922